MRNPDSDAQELELRELCDRYPEFSREEFEADDVWFEVLLGEGMLGKDQGYTPEHFKGRIVAVYKKQVVAIGHDETTIRIKLSKEYDTHPGRFVLRLVRASSPAQKAAALSTSVSCLVGFVLVCVVCVAAISALGKKANATFSKIGSRVSFAPCQVEMPWKKSSHS